MRAFRACPWHAALRAQGQSDFSLRGLAGLAAASATAALLTKGDADKRNWRVARCDAAEGEVQSHLPQFRPPNLAGAKLEPQPLSDGSKLVLSADCGGTTTRLMLYEVDWSDPVPKQQKAPGKLIREEKYPNIAFKSLQDIIRTFLFTDCALPEGSYPTVAVLAVAGVVLNNACRFTNLDWVVNGSELEVDLKIGRVELINDFVAQGYGMLTLGSTEVMKLNDAEPVQNGTIACIGAGTGLGQCFLVADTQTGDYTCHPSEGQHGEFGPRGAGSDELKLELLKYLKIKFSNAGNRISTERVVSGTGICNIYEFLAYKHPHEVDEEVHEAHNDRPKDAGIIAMNAKPGSLCEKTMKIFADAYGAQCATFALYVQPFGGIYITGGVTKKMREWLLKEGSFMKAYYDKGRLTPVLNRVPLMIVEGDDMGQRGAHLRAVMLLKQEIREQARRLFDTLDFNHDGLLFVGELEGLFEMAGDKAGKHRHELARQLLQELDSNHDGHLDFEEFLKGYAKLPTKMISESPFLHREREVQKEPKMDRTQLVSPLDRGNDVDSQAALAKELQIYQSRSRREKIDPFKDANAPVFQTRLYKLLADHDRAKEESWVPRMYWVSNSGGICYHSVTENQALKFLDSEDVPTMFVEQLPDDDKASCKQHRFRIQPSFREGIPAPATEFAAPTEDILSLWMIELAALQKKAREGSSTSD